MYIYPRADWIGLNTDHFDIVVDLDGDISKTEVAHKLIQAFVSGDRINGSSLDDFDIVFEEWTAKNLQKPREIGMLIGNWASTDLATFGHIVDVVSSYSYKALRYCAWKKHQVSPISDTDLDALIEKIDRFKCFIYV